MLPTSQPSLPRSRPSPQTGEQTELLDGLPPAQVQPGSTCRHAAGASRPRPVRRAASAARLSSGADLAGRGAPVAPLVGAVVAGLGAGLEAVAAVRGGHPRRELGEVGALAGDGGGAGADECAPADHRAQEETTDSRRPPGPSVFCLMCGFNLVLNALEMSQNLRGEPKFCGPLMPTEYVDNSPA